MRLWLRTAPAGLRTSRPMSLPWVNPDPDFDLEGEWEEEGYHWNQGPSQPTFSA